MEIIATPVQRILTYWRFDPVTGFYLTRRGQRVPWHKVRSIMLRVTQQAENEILFIADEVRAGRMLVGVAQTEVQQRLKTIHLAAMALAKGGWAQLAPTDYGRIGGILKREFGYLNKLFVGIGEGTVKQDGGLTRRLSLYARAARNTYFRGVRDTYAKKGFDQGRSKLRPAEHCSDCVDQDALGWQAIDKLVPIGERKCTRNCKCVVYFRNSKTGKEAGPF